jgi:galactose mutarotase-like enzyme
LTVELTLQNESDAPMPAGLGWHPYFSRTPRAAITADVRAIWLTDEEGPSWSPRRAIYRKVRRSTMRARIPFGLWRQTVE